MVADNSSVGMTPHKKVLEIIKGKEVISNFGRIELIHSGDEMLLAVELVCFDNNVLISKKEVVRKSLESIGIHKIEDLTHASIVRGKGLVYSGFLVFFLAVRKREGLAQYLKGVFEDLY